LSAGIFRTASVAVPFFFRGALAFAVKELRAAVLLAHAVVYRISEIRALLLASAPELTESAQAA
jgi:hypothetical protein